MSFEVSPEHQAFRAVIDTALEQVTENALALADEKGLDIQTAANILSQPACFTTPSSCSWRPQTSR